MMLPAAGSSEQTKAARRFKDVNVDATDTRNTWQHTHRLVKQSAAVILFPLLFIAALAPSGHLGILRWSRMRPRSHREELAFRASALGIVKPRKPTLRAA